jgi:hypothetical protein
MAAATSMSKYDDIPDGPIQIGETKRETTDRLRREGRYEAFKARKEQIRLKLKDDGEFRPGDKAWRLALREFFPAPDFVSAAWVAKASEEDFEAWLNPRRIDFQLSEEEREDEHDHRVGAFYEIRDQHIKSLSDEAVEFGYRFAEVAVHAYGIPDHGLAEDTLALLFADLYQSIRTLSPDDVADERKECREMEQQHSASASV